MEFVPFGSKDAIRLSINIIRRLVAVPTKTGRMPTDDDCIKFQMMCQARRLNPFEGDVFMLGYDTKDGAKFSMITAHQAFLKRAELNPEYDGMESGVIVFRNEDLTELEGDFLLDNDVLVGAWARVFFKSRSHPMHKRCKLSTFRKDNQQWRDNPAGMIVKCAEADALRSSFPTMLGGLYLKDEMETTVEAPRVATPIFKDKTPPPQVVDVTPPTAGNDSLEKLQALAERDGVDEKVLIELLQASGLAGDGLVRISELAPDDIINTINSWDVLMGQLNKSNE